MKSYPKFVKVCSRNMAVRFWCICLILVLCDTFFALWIVQKLWKNQKFPATTLCPRHLINATIFKILWNTCIVSLTWLKGHSRFRGGTGSLFLIFPYKDNFCPCNPCQRSKILVILARASGRGQKSWPEWYSGTFCLWKLWIDDNAVYLFINCDSWWKQTR